MGFGGRARLAEHLQQPRANPTSSRSGGARGSGEKGGNYVGRRPKKTCVDGAYASNMGVPARVKSHPNRRIASTYPV
jgi:hypothetical protein